MASTQCLSGRLVPSIADPVRTEKYFLHAVQRYGVGLSFGTKAVRVLRHSGHRRVRLQRMLSSQWRAVSSS